MEHEVHRRWASVALVRIGSRSYRAVLLDELGRFRNDADDGPWTSVESEGRAGAFTIDLPDLATPIRAAIAANPAHRLRDGVPGAAIFVPVFVRMSVEDDLDRQVSEGLPAIIERSLARSEVPHRYLVVREEPSGPLPPPVAPIEVLTILPELAIPVGDNDITSHEGLFHHRLGGSGVEAFAALIGPTPVDLVIASAADAQMILPIDDPQRPVRLAILSADDELALDPPRVGRATIVVDQRGRDDDFTSIAFQVLDGIRDDLPLHDIVAALGERQPVQLRADPWSTHGLRLGDMYEGLLRASTHLEGSVRPWRNRTRHLQRSPQVALAIEALDQAHRLDQVYGAPGQHVAELVEASSAVADAQAVLASAETSTGVPTSPDVASRDIASTDDASPVTAGSQASPRVDLASSGPRVVNMSVRLTGGQPVDRRSTVYVDPSTRLARGGTYELDVQIGAAIPSSIVEHAEPIDPILPDARRGLDIDLILYSLDDAGPPVRGTLHLPPGGASEPSGLALVMPAQGDQARYRLTILHDQNLIQTYRLVLDVGETEADGAAIAHRATLEHSGTERWDNVRRLAPRALSITLNDVDGAHRIFVSGAAEERTAALGETYITATLDAVRSVLERLHLGEVGASDALLELARIGRYRIFQAVAGDDGALLADLARICDEPGTIQITRTQKNFVMPWAFTYDWPLTSGAVPCFGGHPDEPCGHTSRSTGVVCARGFWGFRHIIENLWSPKGKTADRRQEVVYAGRAVGIDIGVRGDDPPTARLNEIALDQWPGAVGWFPPSSDVNAQLFEPNRPPIVLSIGHFDASPSVGERIESATSTGWLGDRAIFDASTSRAAPWGDPSSIMLLFGCGTGAVTPATATGFVATLTNVGAAACVVTECTVRTGLAAPMASQILGSMLSPGSTPTDHPKIGEAVRQARQQLIMRRNDVRPLAFTLHGSADAHLRPTP